LNWIVPQWFHLQYPVPAAPAHRPNGNPKALDLFAKLVRKFALSRGAKSGDDNGSVIGWSVPWQMKRRSNDW